MKLASFHSSFSIKGQPPIFSIIDLRFVPPRRWAFEKNTIKDGCSTSLQTACKHRLHCVHFLHCLHCIHFLGPRGHPRRPRHPCHPRHPRHPCHPRHLKSFQPKKNFQPKQIFTPKISPKKIFTQIFFNIILKYSIVRVSFVHLRWAQLYESLVSSTFTFLSSVYDILIMRNFGRKKKEQNPR